MRRLIDVRVCPGVRTLVLAELFGPPVKQFGKQGHHKRKNRGRGRGLDSNQGLREGNMPTRALRYYHRRQKRRTDRAKVVVEASASETQSILDGALLVRGHVQNPCTATTQRARLTSIICKAQHELERRASMLHHMFSLHILSNSCFIEK